MSVPVPDDSEQRARLALSILQHRLAVADGLELGATRERLAEAAVEDALGALAGTPLDVLTARHLARAL